MNQILKVLFLFLRGIKEKYETHHKVRIKDEAIIGAVELSQRYITNRFYQIKLLI